MVAAYQSQKYVQIKISNSFSFLEKIDLFQYLMHHQVIASGFIKAERFFICCEFG